MKNKSSRKRMKNRLKTRASTKGAIGVVYMFPVSREQLKRDLARERAEKEKQS